MKPACAALAAMALFSTAAGAYPSMIRHGYTQCAACHTDPSGGTLLTKYGRAQSELLLSSRWGAAKEDEPAARDEFLFGLVPTPDFLSLGGWFRYGYIWNTVGGTFVDDAGLVRGGRIYVPFGLRNPEHTSFVRAATRTDINQDQQDGIAVAIAKESWRMEVMAILGNYSLRPDAFRERGLSGYLEVSPFSRLALGVSALVTRADAGLGSEGPTLRQAYGVTARASPWTPLVLLAEVDALITTALGNGGASAGHADWLQADLEVLRGVHILSAVEGMKPPGGGPSSLGFWGGAAWFVFPHLDVRADWIRRSTTGSPATGTFLLQLNGYL